MEILGSFWLVIGTVLACVFEQEFWVGNEELVDMYEKGLGDAGYMNLKLARTNNRGDGMIIIIFCFYFIY